MLLIFLPLIVASGLMLWAGLPWPLLLCFLFVWFRLRVKGRDWLSRCDHLVQADGLWMSEGRVEVKSLVLGLKRFPILGLLSFISLIVIIWKGPVGVELGEHSGPSATGLQEVKDMSMGEIVEVMRASSQVVEEHDQGVVSSSSGEGGGSGSKGWALESWSVNRPFRELD